MTKSTAIRVRMDLAKPAVLSDLLSVAGATKAVEELKAAASKLGFTLTSEVSAKVGSYEFDGAEPGAPSEDAEEPSVDGEA